MLLPIHSPRKGKLRVVGFISGSGKTLWEAHKLQEQMTDAPFEIVGVFSSNKNAAGLEYAQNNGIPTAVLDIKDFYQKENKAITDQEVRKAYDKEVLAQIKGFGADMILLAGYVWTLTDEVLDSYTVVNVHPGDLSVKTATGNRAFAGANGVADTLQAQAASLASTAHIATSVVDNGPILMISQDIAIDYNLHTNDQERVSYYLGLANEQSRLLGARTILEIAQGNFATDADGQMHHRGKAVPTGVKINNWNENKPFHERQTNMLIEPKSVAVIGASSKPGIGQAVVNNIQSYGFEGNLYAVNRSGDDVLGAKGYTSVLDIPGELDLIVLTIPSAGVLPVVEEAGQKGVKAIICITAGFKEVGDEGAAAEEKLMSIVHKYNMRLLGPNCMGLMFAKSKFNATILSGDVKAGNVALISQSGAVGATLLDNLADLGIGLSANISLGNQGDVNVCDLLELLDQDDNTEVIAMYLEAIPEPDRFYAIASKMDKPILLLKSGATEAGASAASSHTGSLAGNDAIADALIAKCGIIRMETMEEMFLTLPGISLMPTVKGNRVAVVTNAGGPGILITDSLSKKGFEVPDLSEEKQALLAPQLMAEASTKNPIDVVAPAPPEHFAAAIKAVADSGEFDAIVLCVVSPATSNTALTAQGTLEAIKNASIPVVSVFTGRTIGKAAREVMIENGVPAYQYPEHVAYVLDNMREQEAKTTQEFDRADISSVMNARKLLDKTKSGEYMANDEAYKLIDCYNIPYAKNAIVTSPLEVDDLEIDYPVVAKIEHPEIIHKMDVGGVVLNIENAEDLKVIVAQFIEKFTGAHGVLVQEMLPKGLELIIGCANDAELGSALMVGMGGTLVEIMEDVTFLFPPFSQEQAKKALEKLKCYPLLQGYRGAAGVNIDSLSEMMVKTSTMLASLPDVVELDLNPIIYDQKNDKFKAADIRIKRGELLSNKAILKDEKVAVLA